MANLIFAGPIGPFDAPDVAAIRQERSEIAGTATYRDGSLAGAFGEPGSAVTIGLEHLPERFVAGLIAAEDKRFWDHPGVDPFATARAAWSWLKGGRLVGASTITQQTVKNTLAGAEDRRDRDAWAKIREAVMAYQLESRLSKDEILNAYVNSIYFGRGVTGAAGAARAWFGRGWNDIDLGEQAFLAGVINAPSVLDPTDPDHASRARQRRDYVVEALEATGSVSPVEVAEARREDLIVVPAGSRGPRQAAAWAALAARSAVRREPAARAQLGRLGLEGVVRTTIDPAMQALAETVLRDRLDKLGKPVPAGRLERFDGQADEGDWIAARRLLPGPATDWTRAIVIGTGTTTTVAVEGAGERQIMGDLAFAPGDVVAVSSVDADEDEVRLVPVPDIQGAVVVMDIGSGDVLAYVGGYDATMTRFDRARALRQPGSAVKPFLYVAALDQGMAYDQLVLDVPVTVPTEGGGSWTPSNYGGGLGVGAVPLFAALEESSNFVAARLGFELGVDRFADIAEAAGAYTADAPIVRVPSAVLGSSETSLVNLVAGFASLAAGGVAVKPRVILEVRDGAGEVVWRPSLSNSRSFASYRSVALVQSMLAGVTERGTARKAFKNVSVPVVGKTGTSQDYRDAWFVGFTPEIAVGVWIGRDNGEAIGAGRTGGNTAAPVAAALFQRLADEGLTRSEYPGWPPELLEDRAAVSRAPSAPVGPLSSGAPMRLDGAGLDALVRDRGQEREASGPDIEAGLGSWRSNNDLLERRPGSGNEGGLRFRSPW
ncbi:transglycosylase domain-containing protein [Amorphus sp. 3PC139-8]|uniref:transglycosylase domain-containing protein n=1 Tax=Amorphus sp. 3PC139-8 TaxID=2735676 RepID=UPI00345CDF99